MNLIKMLFLMTGTFLFVACEKESCGPEFNYALSYGTFTDPRDGNEYKTIRIGSQVWMAENLRYTGEDEEYHGCFEYGQLYDMYTIETACPEGWHIPSKEEWQELVDFLGGPHFAGGSLKERGTAHWSSPNSGATNLSGFTALPAGKYDANGGGYGRGYICYFYTSTKVHDSYIVIEMSYNSDGIAFSDDIYNIDVSLPIRCVKDKD